MGGKVSVVDVECLGGGEGIGIGFRYHKRDGLADVPDFFRREDRLRIETVGFVVVGILGSRWPEGANVFRGQVRCRDNIQDPGQRANRGYIHRLNAGVGRGASNHYAVS